MTKKNSDVKHQKKISPSLPEVGEIYRTLAQGDFFMVRRHAQHVLATEGLHDADREYAEYALRVTWPETGALLAGLACLAVITVVAFIVGY